MELLSLGLNINAQQYDYGETEKKDFLYHFIGDSDSLGLIFNPKLSNSIINTILSLDRKSTRLNSSH